MNTPNTGLAKKPAKAQITALRAIFADVDAKEGRSLDEAPAAIAALPTPPSVIIASGGGFQPVWLLDAPVPATSETKLKHLMRKAAERTVKATWKHCGELLDHFKPDECGR